MGINIDEARALLALRREGRLGSDILCLGRPETFGSVAEFRQLGADFGLDWTAAEAERIAESRFAEPLLEKAGFTTIRSLDASPYEGADIVHDLNTPIPDHLKGTANFVYDGGTIEHVFDVATALRNLIDLTAVGGTVLMSSPANGQCGHGFYQFSPELLYRLFEANGFEQIDVYLVGLLKPSRWFHATDPRVAGRRIQFANSEPMQMLLVARKARALERFVTPQQSDYADLQWGKSAANDDAPVRDWNRPAARMRAALRDRLVYPASVLARHIFGLGMPGLWKRSHFRAFDPVTDKIT